VAEATCGPGTGDRIAASPNGKNIIHCGNFKSACSDSTIGDTVEWNEGTVFYCSADSIVDADGHRIKGAVIFPIDTVVEIGMNTVREYYSGATAAMSIEFVPSLVAHEWGHHITDELKHLIGIPAPDPPNKELLADCLAGVDSLLFSMATIRTEGLDFSELYPGGELSNAQFLEAWDENVIRALAAIADVEPGGNHGTDAERVAAFQLALKEPPSGDDPTDAVLLVQDVERCLQTYWTAIPLA
jgi:hypothetical protein